MAQQPPEKNLRELVNRFGATVYDSPEPSAYLADAGQNNAFAVAKSRGKRNGAQFVAGKFPEKCCATPCFVFFTNIETNTMKAIKMNHLINIRILTTNL